MPGTLVDRLPLPSLKLYTTGSVLVLSIAVYYALNVTSDPNWRSNSTVQRQEAMPEAENEFKTLPLIMPSHVLEFNETRNFTKQFVDVMTFMMQEPLCMWTVINMAYCALALCGFLLRRVVFGQLRVAEAQRLKDKFWNYLFYKFIFVFGVINVQYMDEVMLWCSWFTLLGFLHLFAQLCKDRYEYLSSSPNTGRWAHARLLALLVAVLVAAQALLLGAFLWVLPAGRDIFAFMAAECSLVSVCALHVCARYVLQLREADAAGALAYYTHLAFDSVSLVVELMHVVHMVVYSNMLVSMASLVLLMQLRHLLHELQARVRRHRLYTSLATHMSRNYPMASKEEVDKNQDNCAICWEPMKEARKLPCAHLFHNSCLCQWVQQDASCPTCRRALSAAAPAAPARPPAPPRAPPPHAAPRAPPGAAPRQPNHFFHFDGSRYVSWLPSFSVEVTRVFPPPLPLAAPGAGAAAGLVLTDARLETLARQVQQMFPQYGLATLRADLASTRSTDLTLENILEGRLAHHALEHQRHQHHQHPQHPAPAPPRVPHSAPARVPHPGPHPQTPAGSGSGPSYHYRTDASREFPESAAEREATLRRRKDALLATARHNYLERASRTPRAPPAPRAPRDTRDISP